MVHFNSNINRLEDIDFNNVKSTKSEKTNDDNSIFDNMDRVIDIDIEIGDIIKTNTKPNFGIEESQKGDNINDKTKQKNIEEKKAHLSPEEQAVFSKYQDAIANMDEDDDIADVLNDLISEMSDEELLNFLSAYDYVFDEDGGMEALVSSLFNNMVKDGAEDKQVEVFKRFANILSDEDKKSIEKFFSENMDDTKDLNNNQGLWAFLNGKSYEGYDYIKGEGENKGVTVDDTKHGRSELF